MGCVSYPLERKCYENNVEETNASPHFKKGLLTGKQVAIVSILKKIAPFGAVALLALSLGACRPMYGQTTLGANPSHELASIEISPVPGRIGQKIRNELIFMFTGGNNPVQPNYSLEIAYRESVQGVLYKRTDDSAGQIYSLDATYTLRDASGKNVLSKGKSHARAAFDKHTSTYANVRASRDAGDRAAKDVARDINTRIAAYISSNH